VCGDRAAEIARQQDRAENGSARNRVDDSTGEFEDSDTENDVSEYPNRANCSSTPAGFKNFGTALAKTIISTGRR